MMDDPFRPQDGPEDAFASPRRRREPTALIPFPPRGTLPGAPRDVRPMLRVADEEFDRAHPRLGYALAIFVFGAALVVASAGTVVHSQGWAGLIATVVLAVLTVVGMRFCVAMIRHPHRPKKGRRRAR